MMAFVDVWWLCFNDGSSAIVSAIFNETSLLEKGRDKHELGRHISSKRSNYKHM